jgi:MFS transporter, DHA1 family, tetracycline resistance protein
MSVLSIIFVTIFLDLMGFGLIIPILPFYVQGYDISPTYVTLLSAVYSAMQLLASPILGRLSDRVGRKPVILMSIVCIAAGYLCFAQANTWLTLMLARALSGLGAGNLGVAQAMIADLSTNENRTRNMGLIGVAFGLGFILGPAVGGLLSQYTLTMPIYTAMALSILNGIMVYFFMPRHVKKATHQDTKNTLNDSQDRLDHRTPQETQIDPQLSTSKTKTWINLPLVRSLLGSAFIFSCAFTLMEQCIGFYIEKNWVLQYHSSTEILINTSSSQAQKASMLTSYFLIVVGITAIWVQGFLIKYLSRSYSNHKLILVGLSLVSLSLFIIPNVSATSSFFMLLPAAFIMSHGTGLLHPSRSALLSSLTPSDVQGSIFGWYHSASALGRMIGPSIAGLLFEWHDAAPFYLSSFMIFLLLIYLAYEFMCHDTLSQRAETLPKY